MTNKEIQKKFSEIDKSLSRNSEHTMAIDRHLAFLQNEWKVYEDAYRIYTNKHNRLCNLIYAIYHRIRYCKWPDTNTRVARHMARIFNKGSRI